MRNYLRLISLALIVLPNASCVPFFNRINHDPDTAAIRAIEFAKEAFIDLNQPEAYSYFTEEMQRNVSFDKYIDTIARMHPLKFPQVVTATEYEPIPGKESLVILLDGENADEKFHYRLTMAGTTYSNYEIAGMFRVASRDAASATNRRPLPVKRSTAELR
jgi:hypothetical protein